MSMDDAIFWAQFIGWCVVLTVLGTLTWKRPGTIALSVTGIIGLVVMLGSFRTDSFWVIGVIVAVICAFPITIVTAIVTESLMDKYGSRDDE